VSVAALALSAGPASASRSGQSATRPGPDILYAKQPRAPQLENTGVWRANPILVSGASAYRDGEFLYQDFLYDDHGPRAQRDPADPRMNTSEVAAAPNGTYTYPTDPAYAGNAADLVELRVRPLRDSTAFRVTLNTLIDPERVAFTIAIGGDPSIARALPHGARASAPADLFLTVHGHTAELSDAATGAVVGAPNPHVDLKRRQFTVEIPHERWDPGQATVRLAAGVGLWDRAQDRYLIPAATATADTPGGAGGLAAPTGIFNAAFRFAESFQGPDFTIFTNPGWWRDRLQGLHLKSGNLGQFSAQVDFAKLQSGVDDDMAGKPTGVPQEGPINRIYASRFETAQGIDFSTVCLADEPGEGGTLPESCNGEYRGRLQPYAVYVPHKPQPTAGYGLTLLLHSFGGNYNQFAISRNQSQFGERGAGSLVVTPHARGPDGFYLDHAGADVFEVWADVKRHYRIDPSWTAIAGYSMGGYGAYKLSVQFPDLFARVHTTVGPPGIASVDTRPLLESLRNVPTMIWAAGTDELVAIEGPRAVAARLDALGYRFEFDEFLSGSHLLLAFNDQYQPAADFLGEARVEPSPSHVSYAYNPGIDFPAAGTAAGHAYWVSRVRLRDPAANGGVGVVDVRSEGFGAGDAPPSGTITGFSLLDGGVLANLPYTWRKQTWGDAPAAAPADRLVIDARNVSTVTIDPRRARVSCRAKIGLTSDGPVKVRLAGCKSKHKRWQS
jgi:predicted esterase